MQQGNNLYTFLNRIIELHFSITHSLRPDRPIPSANNQKIVIAIINYFLNKLPLFLIGSRKQLHTCRNTIHFHQRLSYILPLIHKVYIGRTYEYLITLIHSPPHPVRRIFSDTSLLTIVLQ
ncbi:hypothetical protein D3C76_1135880 [compost metagenome]